MFLLNKPSDLKIRSFISAQQQSRYSYPRVGVTRSSAPVGYNVDHNRVLLGSGAEAFSSAVAAVKQWKMFAQDSKNAMKRAVTQGVSSQLKS